MSEFNKFVNGARLFKSDLSVFEEEIERRLEDLKLAKEDLDLAMGAQRLECKNCKKRPRINESTYIQTYFHVPPRGCSGGDYHLPGEGCFKCPHCGMIHRLIYTNDELKDDAKIVRLKSLFKNVEDFYK